MYYLPIKKITIINCYIGIRCKVMRKSLMIHQVGLIPECAADEFFITGL